MNKNRVLLVGMLAVSLLLFLLRMTGLTVHIVVSVLGLAIMIPITLQTRKEWKIPALEVIMRVMYLAAVITGGALMKLAELEEKLPAVVASIVAAEKAVADSIEG